MKSVFVSFHSEETNMYFNVTYLENRTALCHLHQPKHLLSMHLVLFFEDHLIKGSNSLTMQCLIQEKIVKTEPTMPTTDTVFRYMNPSNNMSIYISVSGPSLLH